MKGGPSCNMKSGPAAFLPSILPYKSLSCHCCMRAGSRCARFPRIGKPVCGKLSVSLRSWTIFGVPVKTRLYWEIAAVCFFEKCCQASSGVNRSICDNLPKIDSPNDEYGSCYVFCSFSRTMILALIQLSVAEMNLLVLILLLLAALHAQHIGLLGPSPWHAVTHPMNVSLMALDAIGGILCMLSLRAFGSSHSKQA